MRSLGATALLALALPLSAQSPKPTATPRPTPRPHQTSLADVVKHSQQQSKPQKKKRSLGVITNETLKSKKQLSEVSGTISVPTPAPRAEGSEIVLKDYNGKTEQAWRDQAVALRKDAADTRERVQHLESESKRLENDFYAWSDGNYRENVIKPSWDRAKEDLAKARAQLDQAESALSNLEDEARKAGASPGWVR
ncbi:MAG TPA: hypothetical protein VKF32_14615 [Thermoanaerobaculia bacterium]|nr:hypothetical protein [Thermoanaerobaculia bacterium]